MNSDWIMIYFLPTVGFISALVLFNHILSQRRSPPSTLAWLLTIFFIPYVGVPLYLMLGRRKMIKRTKAKNLPSRSLPRHAENAELSPVLLSPLDNAIFPPTGGNRVRLLATGEETYTEARNLIMSATHHIFIATFILGKDATGEAIITALAKKAAGGVAVYLLLDALGSARIHNRFLSPLLKAGGKVAFFMPMLHLPFRGRANLRNHRKMLIVDSRAALIGGMNFASDYMGPVLSEKHWKDLSLGMKGPEIAHLNEIFLSDWEFAAHEDIASILPVPAPEGRTEGSVLQLIASGPDVQEDTIREMIITALFKAESRVWITSPYFVPDELLAESLCMAARRGIDLQLILPRKSNHRLADLVRESYLTQLQQAGAKVLLFQPGMMHAKAILIDDTVAVTGSANMDMRSLLLNYELALGIYSKPVVREIEIWMATLMNSCMIRNIPEQHPFGFFEGIARLLAPLL
ncbi:MAG: cardiolipin synthase [Pseudomonadota bacterium]